MRSLQDKTGSNGTPVGQDLRALLAKSGLKISRVALEARVSEATVRNILKGRGRPRESTIKKLRIVLQPNSAPEVEQAPQFGVQLHNLATEDDLPYREVSRLNDVVLKPKEQRTEDDWRALREAIKSYPSLFCPPPQEP